MLRNVGIITRILFPNRYIKPKINSSLSWYRPKLPILSSTSSTVRPMISYAKQKTNQKFHHKHGLVKLLSISRWFAGFALRITRWPPWKDWKRASELTLLNEDDWRETLLEFSLAVVYGRDKTRLRKVSLFLQISWEQCTRAGAWKPRDARNEGGTRVAICVSRVLLDGLQKKERLLVV